MEALAGEIEKLGKIVTRLAKDFNAVHIDTQKIFDQVAEQVSQATGFGMGYILCRRVMN